MAEERIASVEARVGAAESRMDKFDLTVERMWRRLDDHRDGQVRTQTLVEGLGKGMTDMQVQLAKMNDAIVASNQAGASKWEQFFAKAFWVVAGFLLAYLGSKIK